MSHDFLTYNQKVMKKICGGVDITNVKPIVKQEQCVYQDDATLVIGNQAFKFTFEIWDVGEHDAYEARLCGRSGQSLLNGALEDEDITEMVEE